MEHNGNGTSKIRHIYTITPDELTNAKPGEILPIRCYLCGRQEGDDLISTEEGKEDEPIITQLRIIKVFKKFIDRVYCITICEVCYVYDSGVEVEI